MAKHLTISGCVQGVNYRESMRMQAVRLGITGWVRNRRDGSVEAVVDGAPQDVEAIIAWAHMGPRGALVIRVEVNGVAGSFSGFERLPTE